MKNIVTQLPLTGARIGGRPLRIGEFVPAAALTARHLSIEDLEDPVGLQRMYVAQRAMQRTLGSALPLETELKAGLTYRLRKLNLEVARFEHTPEFELPTLDPSFLSWKTQAGFPAFSIFHLDSDAMKVSFVRLTNKLFVSPEVPDIMARHYLDDNLHQSLEALCDERGLERIELTAKYGGVMPESVRENIHKWLDAKPGQPRFDEMFIVAEAPEESWEIKEIPRLDPLVIGVAHGMLWLVDAYDLTPIEKFARDLYDNASKVRN